MKLRTIIVAGLLVALGGFGVRHFVERDRAIEEQKARYQRTQEATSIEPSIEAAWVLALDQALQSIEIVGDRVVFVGDESVGEETIALVPRTGLSAACSPFYGVSIKYGTGEQVSSITLIPGEFSLSDRQSRLSLGDGVGSRSPAARALMGKLCRRVAEFLASPR